MITEQELFDIGFRRYGEDDVLSDPYYKAILKGGIFELDDLTGEFNDKGEFEIYEMDSRKFSKISKIKKIFKINKFKINWEIAKRDGSAIPLKPKAMKVKIKKLHPSAKIPKYAIDGDAGLDLTAVDSELDTKGNIVYYTGLAIEIPKGYVGLLFPRSSISNYRLTLTNSVGVIDSNYRGEITLKFKASLLTQYSKDIKIGFELGERVGQLIIMPYPNIEFEEVSELSETERGSKGCGSTGK